MICGCALLYRASNISASNPGAIPGWTPGTRRQGLHSEILLIPQGKLPAVKAILAGETAGTSASRAEREKRLSDDPWRSTPEDDE